MDRRGGSAGGWGWEVSLGQALADDLARMFGCAILAAVLAIVGAFGLGWYMGDRLDLPTVTIEAP